MARYKMDDGVVVETDNSLNAWNEEREWDGKNRISVNTGSQWEHETLYKSRKGRYYIEYSSDWQGKLSSAEWIAPKVACVWLLANDYSPSEIPNDLHEYIDEVSE